MKSDEVNAVKEFCKYFKAKEMKNIFGTYGLLIGGVTPNSIDEMVILEI